MGDQELDAIRKQRLAEMEGQFVSIIKIEIGKCSYHATYDS